MKMNKFLAIRRAYLIMNSQMKATKRDKGILEEIFNETRLLKLEKKVVFQEMSE